MKNAWRADPLVWGHFFLLHDLLSDGTGRCGIGDDNAGQCAR